MRMSWLGDSGATSTSIAARESTNNALSFYWRNESGLALATW